MCSWKTHTLCVIYSCLSGCMRFSGDELNDVTTCCRLIVSVSVFGCNAAHKSCWAVACLVSLRTWLSMRLCVIQSAEPCIHSSQMRVDSIRAHALPVTATRCQPANQIGRHTALTSIAPKHETFGQRAFGTHQPETMHAIPHIHPKRGPTSSVLNVKSPSPTTTTTNDTQRQNAQRSRIIHTRISYNEERQHTRTRSAPANI